ncbi:MAG: bi-domain-containing oxidoreductase [Nannocystaceae bacterium]
MKQILQSYRSGELWLAEVPTAACKSGGLLVRTRTSLVSAGTERMLTSLARKSLIGKARARPDLVKKVIERIKSDGLAPTLEKVFAKLDEPITLGYSATGEVVEVGSQVAGFQPGDRVAIAGAGYATHAEFNYVPANLCVGVPDGVENDDAAFTTVGAIALQGVRQASPMLGERVVVIGLGLLGLTTVQILKANGCAVMGVDLDPHRAALARALGADEATSSEPLGACEAFTRGRGADAVIITAATPSNEPVRQAAEMSRLKGRVVVVGLVGMDIPRDAYYLKELDLRLSMSYGPGRYDSDYEEGGKDYPYSYVRFTEQRNMESFLYLVAEGKVTPSRLVTHRFSFEQALGAYALLSGRGGGSGQETNLETLQEDASGGTGKDGGGKGTQDDAGRGDAAGKYLGILLEYPVAAAMDRQVTQTQAAASRSRASGGDRLGVGFIGAGGFARGILLPELSRNKKVRLTAVCTTTGTTAQQTAKNCGFEVATTELGDVLGDSGTHAVFVVTTHETHASLASQAIRAGKHVFVEKPMGLTSAQIDEYAEALGEARAGGHAPCLMVGFNRRFSPHARLLKQEFGERSTPMVISYRINAGRIAPGHWTQDANVGGGRILGEVCHFVDFCGYLVGSSPIRVTATSIASARRDVIAHDSVVLNIQYKDGSLATIQYLAEGHRTMPKERCEVFAGGESAVMDNFRSTQVFGSSHGLRGKQLKGFAEEISAFLSTATEGGAWPIPWESLVETHQVCFAARRSLETGDAICIAGA